MLWWLPDPSSREGLRAQPGLFVLHPWLGAAEARRLAQAISALDGGRLPLLALPYAQLQRTDPALMLQTEAVLLIELPEGATLDPDLAPKAVVIVRGLRARPSPTQPLREALRLALSVALTQESHPLRLVGAGPWLSRQLARRAAEPDELLDLLDRAVAHRAGLPEQDEEAWARSVEHAAGAHVAERLLRLPPDARWDTLRVVLGLAENAAGLHEGARAGLLTLDGGAPRLTAVARGLAEGEARGGLLAGLVGEELPEDLREALMPPVTRAALMTPEPQPSGAPLDGGGSLGDAARAWVDAAEGLRDEERALLERGVEAIHEAERWAHINEQGRLTTLGPTALALREAGRSGVGAFGALAAALGELLMLAAAWFPEDEPQGARAVAELRRLAERGALPPTVWAYALLRRATALLFAPQAEDRRAEVATLLEEHVSVAGGERARAEGLGLRGLLLRAQERPDESLRALHEAFEAFGALGLERYQAASMSQIAGVLEARGQLDEALRIRREEVLPIVERLGDIRAKAATMGQIADVHQARGQLDEALRIRREEELPIFERLGDERAKAITMGQIADVHQARGQLDEALRIRREEELPVYERLGDVHSKAVTMGRIADVLEARGQLDEALRIRREEVLPIFERLGDVRAKAVTMGQMADVLQVRGQLDEALRIRREDELPVYERLSDVREKAVTMSKIADVLEARGQLDEALRIRKEEVLPVYERLHLRRELLIEQANIATLLLLYRDRKRREEARALLTAAFHSAVELNLPADVKDIRRIFAANNMKAPDPR